MSPLLKRFLVHVVTAYLVLCVLLLLFQRRLVYFPGEAPRGNPRGVGLEFDEVKLVAEDGVELHAWLVRVAEPKGVVLFCHGNAGNIEHRLPAARVFCNLGYCVLLFDYRGYGASEGKPSEEGTYLDAEAAYSYLVETAGFESERIAVYGESLGGAVAIELGGRREVACLVVESAFTSLPSIGAELYPWLPVRLLSRFDYDNESKIGSLGVPVMVIHSPDDEVVPYSHGERLFERAEEPKSFLATSGGHNDGGALLRDEGIAAVKAFLEAALTR